MNKNGAIQFTNFGDVLCALHDDINWERCWKIENLFEKSASRPNTAELCVVEIDGGIVTTIYEGRGHGLKYTIRNHKRWQFSKAVVLNLCWAVNHSRKRLLRNLLLIQSIVEDPISNTYQAVKRSNISNAAVETVEYVLSTDSQNCINLLQTKFIFNEQSSEKSINSSSDFADVPLPTTSACCEKPDRNSHSHVISN
ncbi:hypothetical protein T06_14894 [Trichinella sp. T6]|nr:hypothetical protein T06_14894 [Trichinella sp. T6]